MDHINRNESQTEITCEQKSYTKVVCKNESYVKQRIVCKKSHVKVACEDNSR